jgi:VWFA-related protein
MNERSPRLRCSGAIIAAIFAVIPSAAQDSPVASAPSAEIATHDLPLTFQSKVNLVLVPVVVRDSQGHAIGNLTRDDFQLFDKGKRQEITKFTVEKTGGIAAEVKSASAAKPTEATGAATEPAAAADAPDHFVAYLFDDVHLKFEDLAGVRDAAGRNIDSLQPTDRAAIVTTSGRDMFDFTFDRAKLHEALLKLRPNALANDGKQECPSISFYMANQIVNVEGNQLPPTETDPNTHLLTFTTQTALGTATMEAMQCLSFDARMLPEAEQFALSKARQVYDRGLHDSHIAMTVLRDVVRRMSSLPGQRIVVLASPGFLTLGDLRSDEFDIVDRAVRSSVIINSLDARGLYVVNPAGEIDERTYAPVVTEAKMQYRRQETIAVSGVLEDMASGTGGTFIRNTNDFDGAFRKLASAPEFVYVLGYTPAGLKSDGTFHALTVKLTSLNKLSVQARHGYFAARAGEKPEDKAKQEIADAVFARDEINELPVELHTQFFKSSDTDAKLTVIVGVNLQQLAFRKAQGRNNDDLTIVSALFDDNGNFIAGDQKVIELRLKDGTAQRLQSGRPISVKMPFDVRPGKYAIRLVVRDTEGNRMSAQNGAVEIP